MAGNPLRRRDTLAARILLLLVGMTLLLILGAGLILQDERKDRFEERNLAYLVDQVTTLVWLLQDADATQRGHIIERFSRTGDRISLSDQPQLGLNSPWRHAVEHVIHHKLRSALGIDDRESLRVRVDIVGRGDVQAPALQRPSDLEPSTQGDDADGSDERHRERRLSPRPPKDFRLLQEDIRTDDVKAILISARLHDGTWVNFRTMRIAEPPPWAGKTLQLLGLLLAAVIATGLGIARKIARSMADLADAANRFGRGEEPPRLREQGPREIRETIRAVNLMQERLHKHIQDRSRLLAAVSHDLRTPITTLRLRAEYIEDTEMRERTLATLAEMESILSATLSFARDEAADEAARATNLAALLQSLVDDHADLGGEVAYEGPDRLISRCRPVALKRALSNLIDNAVKYGGRVQVGLHEERGLRVIRIDDDGPGIPEEQLDKVFEPFFRLEASRSRETGGTGLGLSVARTIVHAHGGTLTLENRPGGGLRATVRLPV
ncbi:signal transduction histidine kinase [Thioflavicoccus mobilis 8321]|uniref:histidine kinase n=1 Tax=Thioflavicoccus mobilis 8321 TaxID=765912 RepID=L0GZ34_9GAMM|nr:ATP-binding protein [Thioflavicoccus mobilis]AGA91097.1 signal transduction histidine kinase [Thioflavicoccus mobilis 8321]